MTRIRIVVIITSIIQIVVSVVWFALIFQGSNPHRGTVINLAALFAVGLVGLITQANGTLRRVVVAINWLLAGLWTLGLFAAISRMIDDPEMRSSTVRVVALTLAILIPCIVNGVVILFLPKRMS